VSETFAPSAIIRSPARRIETHYWATLFLLIALVPLLRAVGLPVKFTWADFFVTYWFALPAQALFAACILYAAGGPYREALGPFVGRIKKQPARLLIQIFLGAIFVWIVGPVFGVILLVDSIAVLEFVERSKERPGRSLGMCFGVVIPAAYSFVALILVFAYNDIIALRRYDGSLEAVMNRADAFLLAGHTVSSVAHAVLARRPHLIPVLEVIYFAMFAQIGATIAILALRDGRSMALKFVGTLVTSYYIALIIFYLMPAFGPVTICPNHFLIVSPGMKIYELQRVSLIYLNQLTRQHRIDIVGTDYFIGLPCMHVVQPLIMLWFLRRWKGMMIVLIAYDVLLVPAILLLEQHYLVDLIAALPVAALAIAISGRETGPDQAQHV
jgi:hypothetical protein